MKLKNKLLTDTSVLTLNNVVTFLIGIIQAKILSVFFTTADVGLYSQVNITTNLILSFFVLGLPGTPHFFIPKAQSEEQKKDFVSQLLFLYNILGIVSAAVITVSMPSILSFYDNPALKECTVILILQPWIKLYASAYNGIMIAQGKAKQTAVFSFIRATTMSVFMLGIVFFKISVTEYIYLNFAAEVVFSILMLILSIKSVHGIKPIYFNKSLLKEIFSFSIPLAVAGLVGTLTVETDKLFVSYFYGVEQLGVYSYIAKELPLTLLTNAFLTVCLPIIVKYVNQNNNGKALKLWKTTILFSMYIMAFGVAALIAFSREIITLLYTEEYLSGQNVFITYACVLLCRVTFFGMILKATGKTKSILLCSVFTLIFNVILNLILRIPFGLLGFALGTVISIFINCIVQLIMTSKLINVTFKNVFPWLRSGKILLLNAVFGVGMYFSNKAVLHFIGSDNVIISICVGMVWSVLYIVFIGKKLRGLSEEMKELQNEDAVVNEDI